MLGSVKKVSRSKGRSTSGTCEDGAVLGVAIWRQRLQIVPYDDWQGRAHVEHMNTSVEKAGTVGEPED